MGCATVGGGGLAPTKGAGGACDAGGNVEGAAAEGAACADAGWTGAAGCANGLAADPMEYPVARALSGSCVAAPRSFVVRGANSSRTDDEGVIVINPPHTAQRARTIDAGSLVGSTRKTDRHSGHPTFTAPPVRPTADVVARPRANLQVRRPPDSVDGQLNTPSRVASWRSSSSRSLAH